MHVEGVVDVGGRADRKGVPFEPGDLRYLDAHPVAGAEVEPGRPLDDEVRHAGRKYHPCAHHSLSATQETHENTPGLLADEEDEWHDDPLPEVRRVHHQEHPVDEVKHVGEVEDLEVTAPPHVGQRADEHHGQDYDEPNPGDVGEPVLEPKHARHCSEDAVGVAPPLSAGLGQAGLAVGDCQVQCHSLRDNERVRGAELREVGLSGDNVAAGGDPVAKHRPVGGVVRPVGGCDLQELNRVGLDVHS